MANWLKILLFGGGVAIAGVGTAYLTGSFDPWLEPERSVIAALPEAETLPEPAALQIEGEEEEADSPAIAVEDGTSETADAEGLIIPTFDLVRVEPDGSVVIAGRAAPNSTVEILTGSRIIATVRAGVDGDFAAVLDDPLEPGDYQIVLRSTTDENVVVTSVETAIVSVPETWDGQVLALVEQPGSPSRLITVPDATDGQPIDEEADVAQAPEAQPEDEAVADAAADEAGETPVAEAMAGDVTEDVAETPLAEAETDAASEDDVAELAPVTEAPIAQPDEATAEAETPSVEEETVASAGSEEPVEADAAEATSELIEEEAETDTAQLDESVQPDEETADAAEPTEAEQDVAALQQESVTEPESQQPGAQSRVFVEAVEIDGDTVFVAGHAEPGRFVRVYANEILLGETLVSEGGRFLIEARVDLPVGDYIIRADLLGRDGSVVARAAVPFEREPGETIAAVAPRAPAPREETAQLAPEEDVSADTALVEEDESERAPSDAATAPVGEEADAAEEMAAAEAPSTVIDPIREDRSETDSAAAEPRPSGTGGPVDTAGAADAPVEASEPAEEVTGEEQLAATEDTDAPAEAEGTAQATESEAPAQQMAAADPTDQTMSPALERVDGAVIIRRGDNLWRISRRVYGQGVRFSTIYLANQDQIRDPDRIWPGQVFTVPAETAEGEAADLEALGEQAVDPSQVPGEIIR